ncbi:capZ-interacting protein isoform X1 [Pogona vitticeps]
MFCSLEYNTEKIYCTGSIRAIYDKPTETSTMVEESTMPSVTQLAGKFQEQSSLSGKETSAVKPIRRKPPCSLPLNIHKAEPGQNGELKPSSSASHSVKVKAKSSPLIEKLQANLAFAPTALLPGMSPKSPGLKVMVSPFNSPPSTPPTPQSHSSEPDKTPVSFDQPPEGSHLQFYNKVRTRGSIKRRPPSRRFRRSQSEYDDLDSAMALSPQENGAKDDNEVESVFTDSSKATDGTGCCEKEIQITSDKKSPSDLESSQTESKDSEAGETGKGTVYKDSQEEKPHQSRSELKPCKQNKEENEKSPALDTVVDIHASNQENEGKRENELHGGEGTQQLPNIKENGTPHQGRDTETVENSRV